MNEDIVVPIAGMVMVVVLALGVPMIVMLGKKWQKDAEGGKLRSPDAQRLERIEQAVEAIAIEVERISEAQRFTTKLLAERSGAAEEQASRAVRERQG